MRHRKQGRKLNRTQGHRKSLFRNLITSLIRHEYIETTTAKAKELKRIVEPFVTLAKKDTLHSKRLAFRTIRDKDVLYKLFMKIGPRYKKRNGGYTQVIKKGNRSGDNASLSIIQFVQEK